MDLTSEQNSVKEKLLLFMQQPVTICNIIRVEAPAGCGKTVTLANTLPYLKENLKEFSPIITAPTHEAVHQIKIKIKQANKYNFSTTYSALGYTLEFNKNTGNLELQNYRGDKLDEYNLLIVDEYSCLPKTLVNHIRELEIKVILIGHEAQLPDVDITNSSKNLCIPHFAKEDIQTLYLTKNMRANRELAKFCSMVEKSIHTNVKPNYTYNPTSYKDFTKHLLDNRESFKQGDTKVLAYSNKLVDSYNKIIRKVIHKNSNPKKYLPDDLIIPTNTCLAFLQPLKSPSSYSKNSYFPLNTNTKLVILEVTEVDFLKIPCYLLRIKTSLGGIFYIYTPKGTYTNKSLAKHIHINTGNISKKRFSEIFNTFSKLKHNYAITVHRAQGMTIKNVYVAFKDITKCRNKYLKQRLLYVAYSRAQENLYTIID